MWGHWRFGVLALAAFALNGCAFALSALGSTAGSGAGMGIQHNITGVVSKTYTASLPELRMASLTTLDRMSVTVIDDKQSDEGWVITAKAQDRDISLRLQQLTPGTTRARVAVDNDAIFKDTATAEEILTQTTKALDEAAAVQIEAEYANMKPGPKKANSRQLARAPTKPIAAKRPLSQASATNVTATRQAPGASSPVASPAQAKLQQRPPLNKEHI